jgi:GTP-binding protein LepA
MLQALIFDSFYDKHRGVVAYVRVFSGEVRDNQEIFFLATKSKSIANEIGYFRPLSFEPSGLLKSGEVGYIVCGLKELDKVKVGDTICDQNDQKLQLPGYKEVESKVFSSIFPSNADDYPKLKEAISKLTLNDAALKYEVENIPALGFGFRCGFLGLLHMDFQRV